MDFREELQRIKKVIDNMPMEEFEKMMFDCGLGTILPSGESEFVKCFNKNLFDVNMNYSYKKQVFLKGIYQNFNDFNFEEQEVA